MSTSMVLHCPSCGNAIGVVLTASEAEQALAVQPVVQQARAAAQATNEGIRCRFENGKWGVVCPNSDGSWGPAREWEHEGSTVVKCASKHNGAWCTVRVPLAVARRSAGLQ